MGKADMIAGCLLLGGAFLLFTGMNYRILFLRLKKAAKIPSPAPLIGGAAGALLVICLAGFQHPFFLLLPLLIDSGSIPLLVWLILCLVWDPKR